MEDMPLILSERDLILAKLSRKVIKHGRNFGVYQCESDESLHMIVDNLFIYLKSVIRAMSQQKRKYKVVCPLLTRNESNETEKETEENINKEGKESEVRGIRKFVLAPYITPLIEPPKVEGDLREITNKMRKEIQDYLNDKEYMEFLEKRAREERMRDPYVAQMIKLGIEFFKPDPVHPQKVGNKTEKRTMWSLNKERGIKRLMSGEMKGLVVEKVSFPEPKKGILKNWKGSASTTQENRLSEQLKPVKKVRFLEDNTGILKDKKASGSITREQCINKDAQATQMMAQRESEVRGQKRLSEQLKPVKKVTFLQNKKLFLQQMRGSGSTRTRKRCINKDAQSTQMMAQQEPVFKVPYPVLPQKVGNETKKRTEKNRERGEKRKIESEAQTKMTLMPKQIKLDECRPSTSKEISCNQKAKRVVKLEPFFPAKERSCIHRAKRVVRLESFFPDGGYLGIDWKVPKNYSDILPPSKINFNWKAWNAWKAKRSKWLQEQKEAERNKEARKDSERNEDNEKKDQTGKDYQKNTSDCIISRIVYSRRPFGVKDFIQLLTRNPFIVPQRSILQILMLRAANKMHSKATAVKF